AVFHSVALWKWGPAETGNYVPAGEQAPIGLPESRITGDVGPRCQWSYGMHTVKDKTLWDAQKAFEDYINTISTFNPHKKQRGEWQNGSKTVHFGLSSRMFFKRTKYSSKTELRRKYELHPWIARAVTDHGYFANPDRPKTFHFHENRFCALDAFDPPEMQSGDLVWFSFSVEFVVGMNFWYTTFIPYEFVRVGSCAPHLYLD
ncbi:hypothetical protein C8Q77DRAFT_1023481, partial [Trametes polyzona]